jgi:ribonucleoside-diphosphate reductase beta chain
MSKKILDTKGFGALQLTEMRSRFSYDLWKKAIQNNWVASEVSMSEDIKQWNSSALTDDEKLLIKRVLGFFSNSEGLVGQNLLLNIFKYVAEPSCRLYILRQAFEESLHSETVLVCTEALSLPLEEVSKAYKNIKSIKRKNNFLEAAISAIDRDFDIQDPSHRQDFLRNVITYYIICEGIFFFSSFAMVLALGRQNKMQGCSDQIRFILRDETLHIQFGVYLIDAIKNDYPGIWTKDFKDAITQHIKDAVELEIEYAQETLPIGVLGLTSEMFLEYVQYIGNRRLESIGLEYRFPNNKNPFPWLSEVVDGLSMGAFFERKERSYRSASALVDDL